MSGQKILSFELDPERQEIQIRCNKEGIEDLIHYLQTILNSKNYADHDHWMTPSWGGNELTEDKYDNKNNLIHKVSVYLHKK
jgi:hypothetical protein